MVVAVIAVRMMKASVHQVIHVITMRNGSVAAIGAVNVLPVVAFGAKRAFVGIRGADGDSVFIHVVAMRMMQMAVMKIIHVVAMHDGNVSATFAMDVGMIGVSCARLRFAHRFLILVCVFMYARLHPKRLNHRCGWCGKKCLRK